MTPEAKIYTERIDDIPLLVCQQKKMGIPDVLDRIIQPHGNRQGLSVGWMTTGWLSYIVSEGDHRMVEVEGWIKDHQASLSHLIPQPVRVKDFTDDRLADVLGEFSQDAVWDEIESQLGQHLIRVYDLNVDRIRLDSTSVSVYHDGEEQTLFRPGHSKDHRPDLAQFKVMLGTLDPLGLPLATLVVPGNCADDPLYLPCFKRAQKVVGQGGRLYIGDAKMGLWRRARLSRPGMTIIFRLFLKLAMSARFCTNYWFLFLKADKTCNGLTLNLWCLKMKQMKPKSRVMPIPYRWALKWFGNSKRFLTMRHSLGKSEY